MRVLLVACLFIFSYSSVGMNNNESQVPYVGEFSPKGNMQWRPHWFGLRSISIDIYLNDFRELDTSNGKYRITYADVDDDKGTASEKDILTSILSSLTDTNLRVRKPLHHLGKLDETFDTVVLKLNLVDSEKREEVLLNENIKMRIASFLMYHHEKNHGPMTFFWSVFDNRSVHEASKSDASIDIVKRDNEDAIKVGDWIAIYKERDSIIKQYAIALGKGQYLHQFATQQPFAVTDLKELMRFYKGDKFGVITHIEAK